MATPFRPALDLLSQYAAYHRDRRNIQTHFVGVPMIVFAVLVLLAPPGVEFAGVRITGAWLAFGLSSLWYLTRGTFALGVAVTAVHLVLTLAAHRAADTSTALWLATGIGFFVVGWIIQFIGHYYEGRKPAFADDLVGLLVGPMFVVLELAALLGLFRRVIAEIERRAGPTYLRDLAHPA